MDVFLVCTSAFLTLLIGVNEVCAITVYTICCLQKNFAWLDNEFQVLCKLEPKV